MYVKALPYLLIGHDPNRSMTAILVRSHEASSYHHGPLTSPIQALECAETCDILLCRRKLDDIGAFSGFGSGIGGKTNTQRILSGRKNTVQSMGSDIPTALGLLRKAVLARDRSRDIGRIPPSPGQCHDRRV